jgi:hypothetical protein
MHCTTELAAARGVAYAVVAQSADDETDLKNMRAVYAAETAILSTPLETQADKLTARATLYEDGKIDFADGFKQQLVLMLPQSI